MEQRIRLTREKLDVLSLRLLVASPEMGALVCFEGVVRNHDEGRSVEAIEYEAYESMAGKELARVLVETEAQWPQVRLTIAHRIGLLEVGETSLVVIAASPHRAEAFSAASYAIDRLKRSVPIWKRERSATGEWWKGREPQIEKTEESEPKTRNI